ncbi:hypothetical protein DV515_00008184, partial [Chloebia gouldiae]
GAAAIAPGSFRHLFGQTALGTRRARAPDGRKAPRRRRGRAARRRGADGGGGLRRARLGRSRIRRHPHERGEVLAPCPAAAWAGPRAGSPARGGGLLLRFRSASASGRGVGPERCGWLHSCLMKRRRQRITRATIS